MPKPWTEAYASLSELSPLGGEDLEQLATAAYMLGRVDEFLTVLERAYDAHLEGGEGLRAARCAFYLGMNLALRGEVGRATGWFGRAQRLVEREGDCVERGYLLMPAAIRSESTADYERAYAAAAAAAETAERFGDPDLFTLAVHVQGRVLIRQGRMAEGLALLDEAMLAVTSGRLSPIVTGVVYCGVIAGCEEAYELRRAREWTEALAHWCDEQPDMVAFTGRCRVHRAEIMLLHGAWQDALDEARRARARSEQAMNQAAAGQALYQQGEVLRLRGDLRAAEDAYRDASRLGHEPQPGLALLRLAQGDAGAAAAAIRRALNETADPLQRTRILPAYAEIMVGVGAVPDARRAADELGEIVTSFESTMLRAVAERVRAGVALAEGDAETALVSARRSCQIWQELDAPYEVARTRGLIGAACRAVGDDDTATLELEAARLAFAELGARADLARVESLLQDGDDRDTHGLTRRELEVLRHLATGMSNRQIASALVVSEHTVARHVQNILRKLHVPSRAAATAYAFEHDLLS